MSSPNTPARGLRGLSLRLVHASIGAPRKVLSLIGLITVGFAASFVFVQIDTDPENMLSEDAPVRVANAELRELFGSNQLLVVGLFSDGPVTDADTLAAAATLHDELSSVEGVDAATMISVRSAMEGPLAPTAPSEAWAQDVVAAIAVDPLLGGNVLSSDGDTLAFFVPLVDKSAAQPVRDAAAELVDADPSSQGSSATSPDCPSLKRPSVTRCSCRWRSSLRWRASRSSCSCWRSSVGSRSSGRPWPWLSSP